MSFIVYRKEIQMASTTVISVSHFAAGLLASKKNFVTRLEPEEVLLNHLIFTRGALLINCLSHHGLLHT